MKYFAGYDSGGTKTACVLVDENGKRLGMGLGGPSNYLYCGKEVAKESMEESTRNAFLDAGIPQTHLEAAYIASAAIKLQYGEKHVPFFHTCIDADQISCDSDIIPIWYGTARDNPAVVTIAGTGALTYVCRKDRFTRVSGWGPLLGDEGSGYDLGHRALQTVARMSDGREPLDAAFIQAMIDHFETDEAYNLIFILNKGDIRTKVASAARPVFDLYQKGNETAKKLLMQMADEIALAVQTALRNDRTDDVIPLVCSGSLLNPKSGLFDLVKERLCFEGSRVSDCLFSQVHPAVASAAIALHSKGLVEAADRLLQSEREAAV